MKSKKIVKKRALLTAILVLFIALIGIAFNSTEACRVCVLFLFILCIVKGIREKYFINPYFMFSLVPFTLLIYANISNYHLDLTVNTWIFAIINIVAFIIAFDFTKDYKKYKNCKGIGEEKKLVKHIVIFMILGYIPVVYSRITGGTMPFSYIFTLFSAVSVVCALKSKKKMIISIVFVITLFSWIVYVNKTTILVFIIAVLIGYEKYYIVTAKQRRRLIIISVVGLVIMIFAFSFANQGRDNTGATEALNYYTKYGGVIWNGKATFFMPYMYLTTPWANLQYVMETQATYTYGLWFMKPLLGYFQIDNLLASFYQLKAYSSFNTFTYLAVCFKDFGFWGSCISSVFLGFFTKKVYSRYLISRSPLDIACYVFTAQAVIEMFFSNHFLMQSYPFTIVIIVGFYKIAFCRKNPIELEKNKGTIL